MSGEALRVRGGQPSTGSWWRVARSWRVLLRGSDASSLARDERIRRFELQRQLECERDRAMRRLYGWR